MKISIYQLDAFTDKQFGGNPAAVCLLDDWPEDSLLQAIAMENNLAETAFITENIDGSYQIRWFTPSFEIPLCGHATLASGYVLFEYYDYQGENIHFHSQSGELIVHRQEDLLMMDFPAYEPEPAVWTDEMTAALRLKPRTFFRSGINYYGVYENEDQVRSMEPDYRLIRDIMEGTDIIGFVATAKAREYDFVSRYFAPEPGTSVTEDPVTGSIHSALVPFWAKQLGKKKLHAFQASARGGELCCELSEKDGQKRAFIGGYVQPYLQGTITV